MDPNHTLLLAYGAYLVGTLSPGPAVLAIMTTAMAEGRRAGLALALGVVTGSLAWGGVAALGLGALLETTAGALALLKIAGGLYLIWLAWRALRGALAEAPPPDAAAGPPASLSRHWARGLGIHLTNPKAVFVWMAIIAIGLPAGSTPGDVALVVGGCAVIGVGVFLGYAIVFSTGVSRRVYLRLRRLIGALAAAIFGGLGVRLVLAEP